MNSSFTPLGLGAPGPAPTRRVRPSPEFLRYFLVSVAALALDVGLLGVLVRNAGWHYQAAAAAGFGAGTLLAYALSTAWVFRERSFKGWLNGLQGFALIGAAGLALNAVLMWALVDGLHADVQPAKLLAAGASFLFNYGVRRALLFTRRTSEVVA